LKLRSLLWVILVAAVALTTYFAWRRHADDDLPEGVARANGRVEATRIDIATKLPGELLEVRVREGDMVESGQVLAIMETEEIRAMRDSAEADLRRQERRKAEAEAEVERQDSEIAFAKSESDRARSLFDQGFLSKDKLEARDTALRSTLAARARSLAAVEGSDAAIDMAEAEIRRLDSLLAHAELKAPRPARVQYRLAEPGEILATGGRVLTLIDLADVYMSIFLPAAEAGRLEIGTEARVVFDAAPEWVFPAQVSFVAPDAQFTPKSVETRPEREKLMFRVKLTVEPELALRFQSRIKPGLRGDAYVLTRSAATWPEWLAVRLPP
jgi:HlyD family secretion protein